MCHIETKTLYPKYPKDIMLLRYGKVEFYRLTPP
jgi:hypothetical protein